MDHNDRNEKNQWNENLPKLYTKLIWHTCTLYVVKFRQRDVNFFRICLQPQIRCWSELRRYDSRYCIDYTCSRTCINSSCGICMFSLNIFAQNCDEVWIRQKHQSCIIKCGSLLAFYFELTWYSFHAINWAKWVAINYSLKLVTKWMNVIFYKFTISFDS